MPDTLAAAAMNRKRPNYCASALALLGLGFCCFLLGTLIRSNSLTAHLDHTKPSSVASTSTWISKKCLAAPKPLDRSTVGKKTVLITGATSLLGYHLVSYCADVLGMTVIAVDENTPESPPGTTNSTRYVKGNLQDASFVKDLFSWYQFDVVYHLAEYGTSDSSFYLPASNYKSNLVAAVHVLNGAIKTHVRTFLYLSSIAVYGDHGGPYAETTAPNPQNPFGIAKVAMEQHVQLAAERFGFTYVIVRAGPVFGPGAQTTSSISELTDLVLQARSGKALIVPKAENQLLPACYVKDVAPMVAEAALMKSAANQVINMATDRLVTYSEATEVLADAFEADLSIGYLRPQDELAMRRLRASYTKMHCLFGDRDDTPLGVALNETVAWLKAHPEVALPAKGSTVESELVSMRPGGATGEKARQTGLS